MKKRALILSLIIFAMAVVGAADAQPAERQSRVIALDSNESTEGDRPQCSDNVEAMSACRSFIKGFIQGALLTDTAIIKSIEEMEPTAYTERAIRTRLGKRSTSPTALAGFCLPENQTVLELAEETLDHVKASERNSAKLANNVYNSLKVDYPCE